MFKCMVNVMVQSSSKLNQNTFKITPCYSFLKVSLCLRYEMNMFLKLSTQTN